MDRDIEGMGSAEYLWKKKRVVPFLKIDKGLEGEVDGVQLMKPMPGLDELLTRAAKKGVFGTKERSIIELANQAGIESIVDQQFDVARQVLAAGLVPIIEPEVDIHSPQKAEAEKMLKASILRHLDALPEGQPVMLKLTLQRPRHPPEGAARRGVVGRVRARRSQFEAVAQPRRDRELLPRAHRRAHRAADRRRLRRRAGCFREEHLRGVADVVT